MLFWIIDDEFTHLGYGEEEEVIKKAFPHAEIRHSPMSEYWDDLEEWGKDAIAIIAQIYVNIPEPFIQKLRRTRVISVYGGGYDRVDVEAAYRRGIRVTYVPDYCVEEVSDHSLAFILMHARRMLLWPSALEEGLWGAPAVTDPPKRLKGSTLLIVGFGRMGRALAAKARALGVRVLGYDPYVSGEIMSFMGVEKVDLEEGLRVADFVSIHVPLTPQTRGLLDRRKIFLLRRGAAIINTSRGEVLDEEALVERAERGEIYAYLDVVAKEPPDPRRKVLRTRNIFVTPHIAYYSTESIRELKRRAAENAVSVLLGREPRYEVRRP